jgi:hypothetical protein
MDGWLEMHNHLIHKCGRFRACHAPSRTLLPWWQAEWHTGGLGATIMGTSLRAAGEVIEKALPCFPQVRFAKWNLRAYRTRGPNPGGLQSAACKRLPQKGSPELHYARFSPPHTPDKSFPKGGGQALHDGLLLRATATAFAAGGATSETQALTRRTGLSACCPVAPVAVAGQTHCRRIVAFHAPHERKGQAP